MDDFDPKKNEANLRKHDLSLTEAEGVLRDPFALTIEEDSAEGEQRFVTIGAIFFWVVAGRRLRALRTPSNPIHLSAGPRAQRGTSI
jgi:hypothetical protein